MVARGWVGSGRGAGHNNFMPRNGEGGDTAGKNGPLFNWFDESFFCAYHVLASLYLWQ